MVDLGFLLITFFIFTTRLSENKAMKLLMPNDEPTKSPTKLDYRLALTVLLDKNNRLYYYHGRFEDAVQQQALLPSGYNVNNGIGEIIRQKQMAIDASGAFAEGRKEMMLVIKPSAGSNFKNLVDALDEVLINDLRKYAVVDISAEEERWLQQHTPD